MYLTRDIDWYGPGQVSEAGAQPGLFDRPR